MIPGFRLLAVAVVDIIHLRKKMIYVAAANTVWRSKCVIQVSCQHINTSLMCIWGPEHALKQTKMKIENILFVTPHQTTVESL